MYELACWSTNSLATIPLSIALTITPRGHPRIFLTVNLNESGFIFAFCHYSSPSNTFFHAAYPLGFSVMFSSFSYFAPKLFCFPRHSVVGICWCIPFLLADRIFFVVLKCPFLSSSLCLIFFSLVGNCVVVCKVGWLVGFYGISTFLGYLTPNPFLRK